MPIYNGEKFLKESIDSILSQTYTSFEFVIINDASTDNTVSIIQSYKDPRIILLNNTETLGIALSLNKGLEKATGFYIARMDADDISFNNRLEKQVAFMESHPDIAISGTWAEVIGSKNGFIRHPTEAKEIKANLLFRTSLVHPTIIMRADFLRTHNLIYQNSIYGATYMEDYDLYSRAILYGDMANLGETLLYYRKHDKQSSVEHRNIQIKNAKLIVQRQLERLGINPTEQELDTMASIKRYLFLEDKNFLEKVERLFIKIKDANDLKKIYDEAILTRVLGNTWLDIALAYSSTRIKIWPDFWNKTPRRWISFNLKNIYRISKILFT